MANDMALIQIDGTAIAAAWNEEGDFEQELRAAFARSFDHRIVCWCTQDEQKLRAACYAALVKAKPEDKEWLEAQIKNLQKVNAILQAAMVGIPLGDPEEIDIPKNERDYNLERIFHEEMAKAKKTRGF